MTHDVHQRLVPFEACFNFRDLGGYSTIDGRRIRQGVLYRADSLHRLTDADVRAFHELGLRAVIDLRSAAEIDDFGRFRWAVDERPTWHHVPMIDEVLLRVGAGSPPPASTQSPADAYGNIVAGGTSVARVFGLLATADQLPAVFHCTSGKDRTGIIAAMVLDLLGVPDSVIAVDYAITNETRRRSTAWIEENEPAFAAFLALIPEARRHVDPQHILGFLDQLRDRHGSIEGFLVGVGVHPDALADLRTRLLTD